MDNESNNAAGTTPQAPSPEQTAPATTAPAASEGSSSSNDGAADSGSVASTTEGSTAAGGAAGTGTPGAPRKRRRGKRGGKRHRKPGTGASGASGGTSTAGDDSDDAGSDDADSGSDSGSDDAGTDDAGTTDAPKTSSPRAAGSRSSGSRPPRQPRPKPDADEAGSENADGSESPTADAAASDAASDGSGDGDAPAPRQPRPRQPRAPRPPRPKPEGGDGQDAPEGDSAQADAPAATADGEAGGADGEGPEGPRPASRNRRRRGGRGRGRGTGSGGGGGAAGGGTADGETASEAKTDDAKAGGDADAPKETAADKARAKSNAAGGGSTRLAARQIRREQQQARGRKPRKRLTEADARALRGGEKTMLVHEHEDRTQIAVLEEGDLIEHFVARRGGRTSMAGNIFLARVQNVLPGMEAAFLDFGRGRNGVLYAGEVNYSKEDLEGDELPRIEAVLKSGQSIMVQVTKDPLGTKGARLTSQISIAGRFMVLAPDQKVSGISRRLAENERNRLRQILRDVRPKEHGLIVRTAAEGASKEALERDLANLLKIWENIQAVAKTAKAPSLLHAEPELTTKVVRDIFSGDFARVVVDSRGVYDDIKGYLEDTAPDLLEKLTLHDGALPLLETYRVTEQLQKALEKKVWLPSGGSLIIERTEALTVIDVNTGKFVGKGSNLEETVYKNNLEAAEEVARQLRLRDIGGIIVIDFIDMIDPKNQQELLRTLKRALGRDKTRSQVFEVSNLGLVEMTRKKVSEGLLDAFSEPCPNCEGRGIVLTHQID